MSVPGIPYPNPTIESLLTTVLALKEAVEVLTNQVGDPGNSALTYNKAVAFGLIKATQIPTK